MKIMVRLRSWLAGLTVFYCMAVIVAAMWETGRWHHAQVVAKKAAADSAAAAALAPSLLAVGTPVIDFTLRDYKGRPYGLQQALQKKSLVVLEFYATWCPHCQRSVPTLVHVTQAYPDVQVLAVNAGDVKGTPSTTAAFAKQFHIPYPLLDNPDTMLLKLYAVQGFPTLYIIDRQMTVRWAHSGELLPADAADLESHLGVTQTH